MAKKKTREIQHNGVSIYKVPRRGYGDQSAHIDYRVLMNGCFTTFKSLKEAKAFIDSWAGEGEMSKIEYTVIDYQELEKKIQTHFGRPDYNIVADEEWNNDSQHSYEDVNGKVDYPAVAEEFKAGRGFASFGLHHLLNQMVSDGALAPGNYLVEVCW